MWLVAVVVFYSKKAQVALHLDELIGVVRLESSLEVVCLVTIVDHFLRLLLKNVGLAVG